MVDFYQKPPIDLHKKLPYNLGMKKIIILICLLFTLTLFGCNTQKENNAITDLPTVQPPATQLPNDTFDDQNTQDNPENGQDEEEQKKKKYYLVATVNSLRIRAFPKDSSTVLGYLDKNDALFLQGEENGYYKTTFKDKTAYVHKNYCNLMEIECESDDIERAIDLGSTLLGYPYVWGSQRYHWGNGKLNTNYVHGEYDCSALVQYVYYKSNNVILDVTSRAQSLNGSKTSRKELKRGDLMFFTNASRKDKTGLEKIGHVGIYFGNNYILHTASDHAVIEPISDLRWSYFVTARRVI